MCILYGFAYCAKKVQVVLFLSYSCDLLIKSYILIYGDRKVLPTPIQIIGRVVLLCRCYQFAGS